MSTGQPLIRRTLVLPLVVLLVGTMIWWSSRGSEAERLDRMERAAIELVARFAEDSDDAGALPTLQDALDESLRSALVEAGRRAGDADALEATAGRAREPGDPATHEVAVHAGDRLLVRLRMLETRGRILVSGFSRPAP